MCGRQSVAVSGSQGGSCLLRECLVGNIFVDIFGFDQPVDDVQNSRIVRIRLRRKEGLRKFDHSLYMSTSEFFLSAPPRPCEDPASLCTVHCALCTVCRSSWLRHVMLSPTHSFTHTPTHPSSSQSQTIVEVKVKQSQSQVKSSSE